MYLCYLDESGTTTPGDTSGHFVYAGIAIPSDTWGDKDKQLSEIKDSYGLGNAEIHTGWIARKYVEQAKIPDFASLSYDERRKQVESIRLTELNRLSLMKRSSTTEKKIKDTRKYYDKTIDYIHLTLEERRKFLLDIARCIKRWGDSRIFFDAIKKDKYKPDMSPVGGMYQDAFHQIVSRFQMFLEYKGRREAKSLHGILVSDNNESINRNLTKLMRKFHRDGVFWRDINNIVETPFFVDSKLTGMIQIADVVAYAIRRFFDNSEAVLFDIIYDRVDRAKDDLVGGRHFTPDEYCYCKICEAHKVKKSSPQKKKGKA